MTAPLQKDLLTNRWRKVPGRPLLEHQLQIALVQHLKYRCKKGVLYFHPANGGFRDEREGAKFRAMGVLPGVADLVFVWKAEGGSQVLFLELKAAKGRQSDAQHAFSFAAFEAGAHYRLCSSLDAAIAELKSLDLLKS